MKKTLLLLTAIALLLTSCAKKPAPQSQPSAQADTPASAEPLAIAGYHVAEELGIKTPDGNEFRVQALQIDELKDLLPRSKVPVLLLKKQGGSYAEVARMESIEVEPHTVGEGLQFITPYKNGFSIQQSFAGGHFLYFSHLYFDYAGNDDFRLMRYTEVHIDRYAKEKDFTELEYEIDGNTFFEDITSDWVYNKHLQETTPAAYGEKSRPTDALDIVFADGTATAWREGLTLTDAQKKAAVAVIFHAGTECSNDGGRRVLGVGLAQEQGGLAWCTERASAYEVHITTIQCPASGSAGELTFEGDKDGSDNLEQIGAFLRKNGLADDTADESLYPAFYFAKNYASQAGSNVWGTKFESGWYLPTVAELSMLYRVKATVNAALEAAGGTKIPDTDYWSSSQGFSLDNYAWYMWFDDDNLDGLNYKDVNLSVCGVRAFN